MTLMTFETSSWNDHYPDSVQQQAMVNLESGQILYFPKLSFSLLPEEVPFLNPNYVDPHVKNISYNATNKKLWGVQHLTDQQHILLKAMLDRFAKNTFQFLQKLLPRYTSHLIPGRTSFRPTEISTRQSSHRKDDKLLHVDAFPSAPNQGKRILRVFTNINHENADRIWRIGEPFEKVAKRFLPHIKKPFPGSAALLRFLKITKSYRTLYDHYMLKIHDAMKMDKNYQETVSQETIHFPPGSTWIVETDSVSHAAMQGQYVLEQTFYLPIKSMQNEALSPLRILEKILQEKLI